MEDAYLLLLELPTPYQYLDSNTILVTYIAPFCSGWLTILAISAIFQLSSIVIEVSPMPVNSLALSLLRLLKSNRQLKHTGSYLRIGDHLGPISSLAWSDNGKQLISVSSHHICFSDIKTGQTLYSQDLFPIPTTVSWSSHGILLAIASQSVKVASITTSQPFQVSSPEQFSTTLFTEAIAPIWSPNGKFITIVTEKSTIRICHAHNGETVIEYKEHTSNVLALAWSPDGTLIASSDSEHNIHIWDTVEGKTSNTNKEHEETIHALAWSANCKHIAFGCDDGTIHISDVETGTIIHTCKGHNAPINALAWSPNSKMIVSGSQDQTAYTWYVEDEKILTKHLAHKQAITALKWSPDGTLIASGSQDATVHIWRAPHIRKNKVTNRKSKTKN
jgi:WD40 repeat protein